MVQQDAKSLKGKAGGRAKMLKASTFKRKKIEEYDTLTKYVQVEPPSFGADVLWCRPSSLAVLQLCAAPPATHRLPLTAHRPPSRCPPFAACSRIAHCL